MKNNLEKLLTVKSTVSLSLTAVFNFLSLKGSISPEQFLVIFTTVISFYFGTQYQKNSKEDKI